jgi:hypothetical protein
MLFLLMYVVQRAANLRLSVYPSPSPLMAIRRVWSGENFPLFARLGEGPLQRARYSMGRVGRSRGSPAWATLATAAAEIITHPPKTGETTCATGRGSCQQFGNPLNVRSKTGASSSNAEVSATDDSTLIWAACASTSAITRFYLH